MIEEVRPPGAAPRVSLVILRVGFFSELNSMGEHVCDYPVCFCQVPLGLHCLSCMPHGFVFSCTEPGCAHYFTCSCGLSRHRNSTHHKFTPASEDEDQNTFKSHFHPLHCIQGPGRPGLSRLGALWPTAETVLPHSANLGDRVCRARIRSRP
jgi:hypothetical protein